MMGETKNKKYKLSSSSGVLSLLFLLLTGFILYVNTINGPFQFDDVENIVENPAIRSFERLSTVWQNPGIRGRIVTFFTFAINYRLHAYQVFGYHLFNLIVHIINGWLVFWLVSLILSLYRPPNKEIERSPGLFVLFVALIFIAHPIQTQAVTYIYQRLASLAALFYLLSICLYLKARIAVNNKLGTGFFAGSFLAAILALFTKEIAFTLPFMIILIELFFIKKEGGGGRIWLKIAPFLALALVVPAIFSFNFRGIIFDFYGPSGSHDGDFINWYSYFLTQSRVVMTYLKLLFFPIVQILDYDFAASKSFFEPQVLLSFAFILAIIIAAFQIRNRNKLLSFGIFWFFLTLLVESSIIPIAHVIFEHRLYLPMVGFSLFLAAFIYDIFKGEKRLLIALGIMLAAFSFLTIKRNNIWRSPVSLWQDVVKKSPQKSRGYFELGSLYLEQGLTGQALSSFDKALALKPDFADVYANRGVLFFRQNEYSKALDDFNKALELDPANLEVFNNRGVLYINLKRYNEAIEDFTRAIKIKSDYAESYLNRGIVLAILKSYNLAIEDLKKAIFIEPLMYEAYHNLGNIFREQGLYDKAIQCYSAALKLNQNLAKTYYMRAISYQAIGNLSAAQDDFLKAKSLGPKY